MFDLFLIVCPAALLLIGIVDYLPKRSNFSKTVRNRKFKLYYTLIFIILLSIVQFLKDKAGDEDQLKKDLANKEDVNKLLKSILDRDSVHREDMRRFYVLDSLNLSHGFVAYNSKLQRLSSPITDVSFKCTTSGYFLTYRVNEQVEKITVKMENQYVQGYQYFDHLPRELGLNSYKFTSGSLRAGPGLYLISLQTTNPFCALPTFYFMDRQIELHEQNKKVDRYPAPSV